MLIGSESIKWDTGKSIFLDSRDFPLILILKDINLLFLTIEEKKLKIH